MDAEIALVADILALEALLIALAADVLADVAEAVALVALLLALVAAALAVSALVIAAAADASAMMAYNGGAKGALTPKVVGSISAQPSMEQVCCSLGVLLKLVLRL